MKQNLIKFVLTLIPFLLMMVGCSKLQVKKSYLEAGSGWVDMGLSVNWAVCNIGASQPEEYGRYFAFGETIGQTWNGSEWSGGGFLTCPDYELDENGNLKPDYDAAHVLLGGRWRMPTESEIQELMVNCTIERTKYKGVKGVVITSKKPGYTSKSIFLPAAGYGNKHLYNATGAPGYYWSSSPRECLGFSAPDSDHGGYGYFYKDCDCGLSIRPVSY